MTNHDSAAQRRSSKGPENLTIQSYREDDRRTLVVTGELDLGSAPVFEDVVASVSADGTSELVLELSQLEFIDATGLDAVLTAKTLAERNGCDVCLTPASASEPPASPRLASLLPFRRSGRAKLAYPTFEEAEGERQFISA